MTLLWLEAIVFRGLVFSCCAKRKNSLFIQIVFQLEKTISYQIWKNTD